MHLNIPQTKYDHHIWAIIKDGRENCIKFKVVEGEVLIKVLIYETSNFWPKLRNDKIHETMAQQEFTVTISEPGGWGILGGGSVSVV